MTGNELILINSRHLASLTEDHDGSNNNTAAWWQRGLKLNANIVNLSTVP